MKVSLKWLRQYVDVNLSPEDLAARLTMVGLQAGEIHTVGKEWDRIVIGEVIRIEKHPNADRLCLPTVNLGDGQCTVVCGAPNVAVGQKVAFARVGAKLYDPHTGKHIELKPAKIRGVHSEGMVCSERELGISESHEGILVLPPDALVGEPLSAYLGDTIFDIAVTPNRPDCLNMIGIAREVAAITGAKVRMPPSDYPEHDPPAEAFVSIEIHDPDLCARYCGGIIQNVKIGPSPAWMQERLTAAGMRPINNIVDITNYVMLEYGQPLHAFDWEKIAGRKIIVRRGRDGEVMTTLDGVERRLNPEMLVIADELGPVALAGVMGGAESEVTEKTTTILLESANFNNISIRRTSRGLGLVSEASLRFDKGLSPDLPLPAIRRAIALMVELVGGRAARGIVDVYPGVTVRRPIRLSIGRVRQVLGVDFGRDRVEQTLASLGFTCERQGDEELLVSVPYWRTDVNIVEDLIEEVARVIGYEEIPTTMLSGEIPHHAPAPLAVLKERIRDILVGCGMQEVITYSMTGADTLQKIRYRGEFGPPMRIANPMSREQEFLRLSLSGGLLAAFAANERNQRRGVMLFEVGKVYRPRPEGLPEEPTLLGGVMGGLRFGRSRFGDGGQMDFFQVKGVVETLLGHLGLEGRFEPAEGDILLSGRCAAIAVEGERVGWLGEVHPDVLGAFDIVAPTVGLFEIEVEKLLPFVERLRTYRPIPRFPSTDRDLALVVDADVPAQKVLDVICAFREVGEARLFDVYQGPQVPAGKKSLAFALRYQAMDRTLTDADVDRIQERILARLGRELGAELRGPRSAAS